MPTVGEIASILESRIPLGLAAKWDNVGLLLGERSCPVARLMTCLTVTPESAAEAIAEHVDLIVTHHPILFRAVKSLTDATDEGRLLLDLVRAKVSIYSPHTAFDNAKGGINDLLARTLGLSQIEPLRRAEAPRELKLVVFVPETDREAVANALFAAGAGQIGNYRECSFRSTGTGTFFGLPASQPAVGQAGRREETSEWRLEVVCPESALALVLAALRQAHSYEEPAFDIYPLVPHAQMMGDGRVGKAAPGTRVADLVQQLKTALRLPQLQVIGEPQRLVHKVAIVCGSGGELFADAVRNGADLFLTGELRFHDHLAAQALGMTLLLPGHYSSERLGVEHLATELQALLPEVHIFASQRERDPSLWL